MSASLQARVPKFLRASPCGMCATVTVVPAAGASSPLPTNGGLSRVLEGTGQWLPHRASVGDSCRQSDMTLTDVGLKRRSHRGPAGAPGHEFHSRPPESESNLSGGPRPGPLP